MRRQATLTAGSAALCVLDILVAPVIALMAGFAADAPNPSSTVLTAIAALLLIAAGSVVCAIVALVAGLLGAPRRLVLWIALAPVLALVGLIVVLSVGAA